jgi:hypothetical protein
MTTRSRYDLDARPVAPVDALLTLGRKGRNGAPVGKDRFWIVSPDLETREFQARGGRTYRGEIHPLHPALEEWHRDATDEERRTVTYEVEAARVTDAIEIGRARPKAPDGRETPTKTEWCRQVERGRADSWDFDAGRWTPRACAGDACPDARGCKPRLQVIGRLVWTGRWSHLPRLRVRLRSRGWGAAKGHMGVVELLDSTWAGYMIAASGRYDLQGRPWHEVHVQAGLPDYLAAGLQVRAHLHEVTRDGGRRRYWSIRASTVQPMADWLESQRRRVDLARVIRGTADAIPAHVDALEAPSVAPTPSPVDEVDLALQGRREAAHAYLVEHGYPLDEVAAVTEGRTPATWTAEDLDEIRHMIRRGRAAAGGEE